MTRETRRELTFALGLWAVIVVALIALHWQWLIVHLSQETGSSNEASRAYAFWSGFGGFTTLAFTGIAIAWRHLNCHTPRCYRLGVHHTPKGYKLCKQCVGRPPHPDLHDIHPEHQ